MSASSSTPDIDPSGSETNVPVLRQELEIIQGLVKHTGEPTWMLFDPLRNQYFRMNRLFFLLLTFWDLKSVEKVKLAISTRLKRAVSDDEVSQFLKFLFDNQLTNVPPQDGYKSFFVKEAAAKKSAVSKALHSYLFFKIPLFRPSRFLKISWPFVRPFFSRFSTALFLLFGVFGLYLVSRQWNDFEAQFSAFLSVEGFVFYALSLVFVKICHELGHAFMAHKYGLEVPIIGAAFLVLMPILYTDTSNAWRLQSRRKRLMIDFAGIMTELALASAATILWVFLPDGMMRSATFSIAAVSWILSLLVNLNPFMRFDGYYILSDALGVENLQQRGFALARWRLRQVLFGLGLSPPENLPRPLQNVLIAHAWGTWIYRFFLFLGIAFLIYTFFIKVIAIILFVVEILYFILLPIFRELKIWWGMRSMIRQSKRSYVTATVLCICCILLFAPIQNQVSVTAVLHANNEVAIYPPVSGKLVALNVSNGSVVERGKTLAVISSQELTHKIALLQRRIELLEKRLSRSNVDALENMNLRVLQSELAGEYEELQNLRQQENRLKIVSKVSGVIVDATASIHPGRYVENTKAMFRVRSLENGLLTGVLAENEIDRLSVGAIGRFYPENMQLAPLDVKLETIKKTSVQSLSFAELAKTHGGQIPVEPASDKNSSQKVDGSFYAVDLKVIDAHNDNKRQTQRGTVKLNAERVSYAELTFARISSVLRRETGF